MPYDFDRIIERRSSNSIKWTYYPEDVLPMWVADMDFPAPAPVIEAIQRSLEHGVLGYEMPSKGLKETVAARMERLYGWKVDPDALVATTGVVSGFFAAAQAFCQPGEGYLIQPPVYMPFNDIQKYTGYIRQEAALVKKITGNKISYEMDWDVFEKTFHSAGSRTKMFLLCNPHNPAGHIYSRNDLARMAEVCLEKDAIICSDEIHSELLIGGAHFTPIATISPEIERRTITLIAPSKTFNIAGLFCGFAIIPDPELRKRYETTVERMLQHVSSLGLVAAQAAFSGDCDEWLTDLRAYLTANRNFMVEYVSDNMPGVNISVPDATYLGWLDCNNLNLTETPFKFFLKEAKVALNDGVPFGSGGEGFVRFNFGAPRATVREGLERMAQALNRE
jgi:cysteine-S-conjugate beta-lyase